MNDTIYLRWKKDNKINSLRDLNEWMNESIGDGRFFQYLHEDKESYDLMIRYLDEIPVTRASAEEIMKAIREEYELWDYQDKLPELLNNKFRTLLSAEEISRYIET